MAIYDEVYFQTKIHTSALSADALFAVVVAVGGAGRGSALAVWPTAAADTTVGSCCFALDRYSFVSPLAQSKAVLPFYIHT